MKTLFTESAAEISSCGCYRYKLTRTWDDNRQVVVFVMLNPSTADGEVDDPTIRKCRGFAERWGAGGLVVVNLFAFRATDPKVCRKAEEPVGPENDAFIEAATWRRRVICAWGAQTWADSRGRAVLKLLGGAMSVECLELTKSGHPRHPLYARYDLVPVPFPPPEVPA